MTLEEIKEIPVGKIAADNCALFLWVTFPRLREGLEVMKAWGFEYKTLGFNWIKTNKDGTPFFGIGHYTKSNPELCLLGMKGAMKAVDNTVSSVIITPREYHSKKPDIVRDKIVQLFGDLPRVELFARGNFQGWDCLGNEVTGEDIRISINNILTKENG